MKWLREELQGKDQRDREGDAQAASHGLRTYAPLPYSFPSILPAAACSIPLTALLLDKTEAVSGELGSCHFSKYRADKITGGGLEEGGACQEAR